MDLNIQAFIAHNAEELTILERRHRRRSFTEALPYAVNTSYKEIASKIGGEDNWRHPFVLIITTHSSSLGLRSLIRIATSWYKKKAEDEGNKVDLLSLSVGMEGTNLLVKALMRYYNEIPQMDDFLAATETEVVKIQVDNTPKSGHLLIPEDVKNYNPSQKEKEEHEQRFEEQQEYYRNASEDEPFLNQIEEYVPSRLPDPTEDAQIIYDIKNKFREKKNFVTPLEQYNKVFCEIMNYVSGIEKYHYGNVMQGDEPEEKFMTILSDYIKREYIDKRLLAKEDLPLFLEHLYNALFKLYVVQDLIDDPMVTDVIISAYNDIRCRIHGKSYLSNLTFVDADDYKRFVWGICLKTRQKMNSEDITFTYSSDDNYILRMELSPEYINSADWPYLHIRKVSRKKLLAGDLIKAGMFDKKIRDYLIDRGRHGKGVVFAGPPGCGKTVILNWFLEDAYEQTADIYCIQENDELFAYRKGVRFQHVVNVPTKEHGTVSLEDLGKHALVAGANVFIIGETKGAEICSAITLSNSGCRTATTLHSQSSTETIEKMCDLAMKGYVQDYVQAKRSLKAFDTIVYLANFKVQEISEIVTFDEAKKDMVYRCIYRRNKEKIAR